MSATTTGSLILSSIADYGTQAILILAAVIGLGVAYIVFKFGWRKTRGALRG